MLLHFCYNFLLLLILKSKTKLSQNVFNFFLLPLCYIVFESSWPLRQYHRIYSLLYCNVRSSVNNYCWTQSKIKLLNCLQHHWEKFRLTIMCHISCFMIFSNVSAIFVPTKNESFKMGSFIAIGSVFVLRTRYSPCLCFFYLWNECFLVERNQFSKSCIIFILKGNVMS